MHKLLFYLGLFALVLGQYASVSKTSGLNIYLFDIAVAVFSLYGLFTLTISKKLILPKVFITFYGFSLIGLVSTVINLYWLDSNQLLVTLFYLIRFTTYMSCGVVIFNLLKHQKLSIQEILYALVSAGVFVAFFGFVQLVLIPDFAQLDPLLGWDPHKNRLASTFFDPNFAGAFLVISLALGIERFYKTKKVSYLFLLAILLISILLTFSRSAWLMLGCVVLVIGLVRSRAFLILAVTLLFLAYFAVPRVQTRISGITDPADSAHFRLISWKQTSTISRDYFPFGTGFNSFRYAQENYGYFEPGTEGGNSGAGSDSSLLLTLATTGILGLVVYCAGIFYPILYILLRKTWGDYFNLIFLAIILSVLVNSQFINSLFYPQIMFLLYVLYGVWEYQTELVQTKRA